MIASILRLRLSLAVILVLACTSPAWAGPGDKEAVRGRSYAKTGRCDKAIPLLEKADELRERPSTSVTLGDCLVKQGQLLRARALYDKVTGWRRSYQWDYYEVVAWQSAKRKRAKLDKRIPTLTLQPEEAYAGLVVEVDGVPVEQFDEAITVDPGEVVVIASADDMESFEETITVDEREERTLAIVLVPLPETPPGDDDDDDDDDDDEGDDDDDDEDDEDDDEPSQRPELWLGARFQGILIPQFVFNFFGDGGTTVFVPGGGLTLTYETAGPELVFGLTYASYRMAETPYKPNGTPNTEWEILESTLMSLAATVDIMWEFPVNDAETFSFLIGGSAGFGVTFVGDLFRTQAYPPSGDPDDPASYVKCDGPNDPVGTFRFCNQLDKDAEHYDGFSEPSWFAGGSRPLIYPWLALPQLGMRYLPADQVSLDLQLAVSVSAFVANLGFRYGL